MADEIVGREAELALIDAFLDRPGDRSGDRLSALVIEGEPGIGKSTLWLAAVAAARERSFQVLVSRPAEAERALDFVVLGDLFADIGPDLLTPLPAPRRRALEAALLREEPELTVDPRAVGVAIANLLPAMAGAAGLVLAIDDDQWIDASSVATLAFALRRSLGQPILLLLSRRLDSVPTPRLEASGAPGDVERLRVGPLSVGATQALLRSRLSVTFPRPMLLRFHELSGGNPFHALELARAQSKNPIRDTSLPLAFPSGIDRLLRARVDAMDAPARRALLVVAAHGRTPVDLLRTVGVPVATLDAALAANLIEVSGDVVAFTHPLLASAVYLDAPGEDRRAAHRVLATALADPVQSGRHLALGADGPSADVSASLEAAAMIAHRRGSPIAAAELAEHALQCTPAHAGDDRHRRSIAAARAQFEAGEGARALEIAADVRAAASAGRQRAEALILSAEVAQPYQTLGLLADALAESADAPDLRALVHARLADAGRGVNELAWAEAQAQASLSLAEDLDDDTLRAMALAKLAPIRFDRGDPDALGLAERAYELARRLDDPRLVKDASQSVSLILTWSGVTDRARVWLKSQLEYWRDRDEEARWDLLVSLALVEFWSGRWRSADQHAGEAQEIDGQYGREVPQAHFAPAIIAVHLGQFDLAGRQARVGLAKVRGQLIPAFPAVLGICQMWTGEPLAAVPYFVDAEDMSDARGLDEVNMRWWRAEYVEALLQAGRMDDAEQLLQAWEEAPAGVSRARAAAQTLRCRGLAAMARGDLSTAGELLELAAERHQAVGDPFGRARALFALGVVSRRARQKRSARVALEAARAGFETLGAMSWVAAAQAELGRIGGRQQIRGLSPSELRVAELVADGRTNREVAAALFLGETTVASHLSAIYSKLGVRSRTELASQLRSHTPPSESTGKVPSS